jgi:TPP-dependent pyruvate/acetoin dehydrogenase alpha subunit
MVTKKFLKYIYEKLYTIRIFETECIKLYRQGLIRGYFHPYLGEEAIAVGVCAALKEQDYITSTHRGHGHCIARGAEIKQMTAELFGKKSGYCKGLGGSMHIADFSAGNLGANGIVGAGIPLGVGAALAAKLKKENRVSVVFTSDGAANNGVFLEALNLAGIWRLPLLLVVENNHYAVSTRVEDATREPDLYKRGIGIGIRSIGVDGNDVLEVYKHAQESINQCRKGAGPVLMEAKTFRHGGHHVNDPGLYMPKERLDYYKSKDPIEIGRKYLLEKGKAGEEEIVSIEKDIEAKMEKAIEFARESPELTVEEFEHIIKDY